MRALIDLGNKPQFIQPLSRGPEPVSQATADRADEMSTAMTARADERAEGRILRH